LPDPFLRQHLLPFVEKVFETLHPGAPFHHNWHIDVMAWDLECMARGEFTRHIINLPPRHLKSVVVSVAFVAWMLGRDPSKKFICASYNKELADKLSRDTRTVMESDWYKRLFPSTRLDRRKQTEDQIHTTQHGYRLATSCNGSLTGLGGDFIIIDDPMKANDIESELARKAVNDWFVGVVATRLNDKQRGCIIVVMQRLHEDDLSGHLLAKGRWEHLCIPAETAADRSYWYGPGDEDLVVYRAGSVLDPAREPRSALEQLMRDMGTHRYSAQYLQEPLPADGALFNWQWFNFYDQEDIRHIDFDFLFISWDVASTVNDRADYSVATIWGVIESDSYLLDVLRVRAPHPELRRMALQQYKQHKPDCILVETAGIGRPFLDDLYRKCHQRAIAAPTRQNKLVRAEAVTPIIESGRVFLPRSAPWLDEFRREILAFPAGKYDDQVDSMVNFLTCRQDLLQAAIQAGRRRETGRPVDIDHGRLARFHSFKVGGGGRALNYDGLRAHFLGRRDRY